MAKGETAIEHCSRCIAEEERLGSQAGTREAGERHFQLAMLYRAQLAVLERKRRTSLPPEIGPRAQAPAVGFPQLQA